MIVAFKDMGFNYSNSEIRQELAKTGYDERVSVFIVNTLNI